MMKTNYYIYFLTFIFSLTISVGVSAQNGDNTYQRMVNTSAKVVQGRIISREEVRYDYDEDNLNLLCGHILEIDVTKSFKGGDEKFKVFAANSDVLMDGDTEYFLFARKNLKFGTSGRDAVDFINCDQEKSTRMDISGFQFLSTRLRQQIFPLISYGSADAVIDEDTGVMKRGQWMMIVNRIANSALPYTIMRRRLNNGNENVIEEMSYADFLEAFGLNR
tara:strand:+ start:168761 stop:169420 length:660 start_codon:yes stop_codon:yes gene_type:complete